MHSDETPAPEPLGILLEPAVTIPNRLLVTGSRAWYDADRLHAALLGAVRQLGLISPTLVSGACPTGADMLAERLWESNQWPIERHPASWHTHDDTCPDWHRGRPRCQRAGYRRNARMAELGAAACVAFPLGESRGTRMMIGLARRAGIPVIIHEG